MRFRTIMIGLGLLAVAILLYLSNCGQTIYALASTNLAIVLVITDAETGKAIPDASVELIDWTNEPEFEVFKLVTDTEGKAKFLRENNTCEEIVRPFRRTVTVADLGWASVNVSAKGYQPAKRLWLCTAKYENKGYLTEGHLHLEFRIPLNTGPRS